MHPLSLYSNIQNSMKRIFLVANCMLFSFLLSAQSEDKIKDDLGIKQSSLDLNIGVGLPISDFGNTTEDPVPSSNSTVINGLASTGFHFDADYGYRFSQFFGAMLRVGGNINSFNAAEWQTIRSEEVPGISTSADGGFYIGEYFIGPFVSIPASDKIKVEIKALAGIITANFPTLNETYPYTGEVEVRNIKSADDFGYYFSVTMKYMIKNNVGINFTVGYSGSSIKYPQENVTLAEPGYQTTTTTDNLSRTMGLGIIQITTGIPFNL